MSYDELLKQFLQRAISGIDASVSFFNSQLPDYINQLLLWYAIKSGIFFLVYLSISILSLVGIIKGIKEFKSEQPNIDVFMPLFIIGGMGLVIFGICTLHETDWLQIMVTPKVWLVEYAGNLFKGK